MDEYAIFRIVEDVSETSRVRVKAAIEGQIARSYFAMIRGEDRRSAGYRALARILRQRYMNEIAGGANIERIGLPTIEETERQVREQLLNPEGPWPPELRAALRARLNMEPEPVITTNAPAAATAPAP